MMRNLNLDYKGEHRAVRLCRQSLFAISLRNLNVQVNLLCAETMLPGNIG